MKTLNLLLGLALGLIIGLLTALSGLLFGALYFVTDPKNKPKSKYTQSRKKPDEESNKTNKASPVYYENYFFTNREEAEKAHDALDDLVTVKGKATIADWANIIGIPTTFSDMIYGWTNLDGSRIERIGSPSNPSGPYGIKVILPMPKKLS